MKKRTTQPRPETKPRTRAPRKAPPKKAVAARAPEAVSPALALAKKIVGILEEKQGQNPVILDVRGRSTVTDAFVVVSGHNTPHLRALLDEVQMRLKKDGTVCYRRAGDADSGWMVLDYVDVVIHILLEEHRRYYAIEDLWRGPTPSEATE